ncbi:MAG: PTS transporter subunit EIIB [Clostridiales bacterium]|nr:PTS transporter subunit EIIB [Clostridiales bacterium]
MKDWNADMDVLFALLGINNMENEFAVAIALAAVAVAAAACLILWLKRSDERAGMDGGTVDMGNGPNGQNGGTKRAVVSDIAVALGGTANIYSIMSSDTRLRVTVNDGALVDRRRLKATGALGVLAKGRQVQVFYEDQVERICRELTRYIDCHRKNDMEQEAEIDYERVIKKVYVPVEGDVVRISDIYSLQDLGNRGVGVCAIRAARGEIRAPFDCQAGYSKTGEGQLECESEDGCVVRIRLIAEKNTGWKRTTHPVDIRLLCDDGERVRKGRLLAEYPYETLAGKGEEVYAVMEVYAVDVDQKYSGERVTDGIPVRIEKRNSRCSLKVNIREKVNYEYVACEMVE